jgi:hypothetical protein
LFSVHADGFTSSAVSRNLFSILRRQCAYPERGFFLSKYQL